MTDAPTEAVIVSGGSSGLGWALLDGCPRAARLFDLSRRGGHPTAEHVHADLSQTSGWDAAAELFRSLAEDATVSRLTFIHNAGMLRPIGFAGEVDSDEYATNVMVNSAAPQILGHSFLAAAARTSAPCDLVLIGSGAATTPYPGWSAYAAAKAAAAMWVQTVGAEQDARGSTNRVVWIAPGVVDTPMQAEIRTVDEADFPTVDRFHALHEDGALSSPDDAAAAIWRVLDGEFENGSVLDVRNL